MTEQDRIETRETIFTEFCLVTNATVMIDEMFGGNTYADRLALLAYDLESVRAARNKDDLYARLVVLGGHTVDYLLHLREKKQA